MADFFKPKTMEEEQKTLRGNIQTTPTQQLIKSSVQRKEEIQAVLNANEPSSLVNGIHSESALPTFDIASDRARMETVMYEGRHVGKPTVMSVRKPTDIGQPQVNLAESGHVATTEVAATETSPKNERNLFRTVLFGTFFLALFYWKGGQ